MRERRSRGRQRASGWLEQSFDQLFLRLSPAERRCIAEELARPFRRQWLIVDVHGVRRLE